MPKQHFFLKLNPCRPTFALDMTEEERVVMQQHVAYWKEYLDKRVVIVFGPVMDHKGAYGIGVVEVNDEEEVKQLIANDPASKINVYEYHPMRAVMPERK